MTGENVDVEEFTQNNQQELLYSAEAVAKKVAQIYALISAYLRQIQTFCLGLVHRDSHDGIVAARNLGAKEARRGAQLDQPMDGD